MKGERGMSVQLKPSKKNTGLKLVKRSEWNELVAFYSRLKRLEIEGGQVLQSDTNITIVPRDNSLYDELYTRVNQIATVLNGLGYTVVCGPAPGQITITDNLPILPTS